MEERLHRILEGWYIFENALFLTSLSHELRENNSMRCAMRCGKGLIEYNSKLLEPLTDEKIEMLLKRECIRIILKHPYERQPSDCLPSARYAASNIIIGDNYAMRLIEMPHSSDFRLPNGKSYEWYAHNLSDAVEQALGVGASASQIFACSTPKEAEDAVSQWVEDPMQAEEVNALIQRIEKSGGWGTLVGNFVQKIVAGAQARVDYRNILAGFRASIISSKQSLTRMKPNRRTGFQYMGCKRRLTTRLLVAVDVSGSVSNKSLEDFLSAVNKCFKYGIEELDLVTFDVGIHDIIPFKKARKEVKITGRGGTDFQAPINYAQEKGYDGLIIFTDGEAPTPRMPSHPRFKMAWVFDSEESLLRNSEHLSALGRCFTIY